MPQSTVARIETGTIYPRSDTLERLLGAAGRRLVSEPKAGYGVDRTQIRTLLALTPTDVTGVYTVIATVRDPEARRVARSERLFGVK